MTCTQALTHYSAISPKMASIAINIRSCCNAAREWINSGKPAPIAAVQRLIIEPNNGIAYPDRGAINAMRARMGKPALPPNAFVKLLSDMFAIVRKSSRIEESQYRNFENVFFKEAGFSARVVFNRLVFALFPEQFCAVPSVERLLKIGKQMVADGLLPTASQNALIGTNWFKLCDAIVPVITSGLPSCDYADRSALLVAIGDYVSR